MNKVLKEMCKFAAYSILALILFPAIVGMIGCAGLVREEYKCVREKIAEGMTKADARDICGW